MKRTKHIARRRRHHFRTNGSKRQHYRFCPHASKEPTQLTTEELLISSSVAAASHVFSRLAIPAPAFVLVRIGADAPHHNGPNPRHTIASNQRAGPQIRRCCPCSYSTLDGREVCATRYRENKSSLCTTLTGSFVSPLWMLLRLDSRTWRSFLTSIWCFWMP